MSLMRSLFSENPMMIEITRFRRKFFGGAASALNSVIVALAGVVYVGVVVLVWTYRESTDPLFLVMLQTGIFTFLAPAMLYGSIAGERERRSWDFLLVAPVTQAQIVCGKFMGAASAILAAAAFFLLPIFIGFAFYRPYGFGGGFGGNYSGFSSGQGFGPPIGDLIEAELLSISWALLLCATTIFFSARCRRGFIALGAVLCLVIAGVVIWPILISSAQLSGLEREVVYFFHPFWNLFQITTSARYTEGQANFSWLHGIPQTLIYLAFTVIFLIWTERTLRFADNETKFIPRRQDA